jgi:hypothetical protein
MMRVWRALLVVLIIISAAFTFRSAATIAANPTITPLIERATDEIIAAADSLVASEATPEKLASLLATRLAESPRNWIALTAIAELYKERGIALPPEYQAALDADSGFLAQTGSCLSCAWDIRECSLSTALICKAPILLTPIEDVRGLTKAGVDYATGAEIDRLDLGLSVVGLSATALILASGGTSATLKAGTALIRMARGMQLLSPRLVARLTGAFTDGIRWADLPAVRSAGDLPALLRADALAPVTATLADLGRTRAAIGAGATLHLLPMVDDAADARALARASEALGPRVVAMAELVGKSRLFRATLRLSDTAANLLIGFAGLVASLAAAISHAIQTFALRALRRGSRHHVPPRRGGHNSESKSR